MRTSLFAVLLSLVPGCQCGPGATLPTGFSQVLETTATTDGKMLSLVLDDEGLPQLAYMNQTGTTPEQWAVLFTRFDGATAKWTTPVTVAADLGAVDDNPTRVALSLARDPKDGRLGIAFVKTEQFCGGPTSNPETTIHVTYSTDEGKTWSSSERVSEAHYTRNDPVNGVQVCDTEQPRLAMKDGTVHLAWAASAGEPDGISYFTGYYYGSSTGAGAWSRTLLPHAGDDARRGGKGIVSLALDSAGAPAVAYVMGAISGHPTTPKMEAVLYARPGGAAVRAADSNNVQNDVPQLALAFDGTKPRIAAHLVRQSGLSGANANWVFSSADGASFSVSQVPDDAEDQGASYMALDFVGGKGALVYDFGSSGTKGACGGPKLSRSADGTTWDICGLDTQTHQFLGDYVTAKLNGAGKVVAAFREDTVDSAGRFKPGIVLYVEP